MRKSVQCALGEVPEGFLQRKSLIRHHPSQTEDRRFEVRLMRPHLEDYYDLDSLPEGESIDIIATGPTLLSAARTAYARFLKAERKHDKQLAEEERLMDEEEATQNALA